jgi:hypothetical protein
MNMIVKTAVISMIMSSAALSAPSNKTDDAAIRQTVSKIYAPFRKDIINKPYWEQPIYSAETRSQFIRWEQNNKRRKTVEIDRLGNGNWLCGCQEYEAKYFRITNTKIGAIAGGKAEAVVKLQITQVDTRTIRFMMIKEKGRWVVDDMFTDSDGKGLKQTLREEVRRR